MVEDELTTEFVVQLFRFVIDFDLSSKSIFFQASHSDATPMREQELVAVRFQLPCDSSCRAIPVVARNMETRHIETRHIETLWKRMTTNSSWPIHRA